MRRHEFPLWMLATGLVMLAAHGCVRAPELEVVATLDQAPGNITVTPDG